MKTEKKDNKKPIKFAKKQHAYVDLNALHEIKYAMTEISVLNTCQPCPLCACTRTTVYETYKKRVVNQNDINSASLHVTTIKNFICGNCDTRWTDKK